jgi:hypothetical protein
VNPRPLSYSNGGFCSFLFAFRLFCEIESLYFAAGDTFVGFGPCRQVSSSIAPRRSFPPVTPCTVERGPCSGTSRRGTRPQPETTTAGEVPPNDSINTATTTVGCKISWFPHPLVDTAVHSYKNRDGQKNLTQSARVLVYNGSNPEPSVIYRS